MTLEDSKKLLRYLAGIDGRKVTNDAAHAIQKLLAQFDYVDVLEAVERVVERHPDDQWISLPKVRNLLESARAMPHAECEHGVPESTPCHDCTHDPDTCDMCRPVAGISDTRDNMRSTAAEFKNTWGRR